MKRLLTICFGNIVLLCTLLLLSEGILIWMGYTPYSLGERPDIVVQPQGKFFQPDSLLGYKHLSGTYEVTLKQALHFTAHHHPSTLRRSHSDHQALDPAAPQLWFFGCSFTYGWSINDEDTFSWLLQKKMPEHRIVNWGVNGYGTLHFYLQLKSALEEGRRPQAVVINHAHFHHERNFFSYNHRISVSRWNFLGRLNQPYACLTRNRQLQIEYSQVEYKVWSWSRKSILICYFQRFYERWMDSRMHKDSRRITQLLLDRIAKLCRDHGVQLLIANIDGPPAYIESYCQKRALAYVDISLDLTDTHYTSEPYDRHPNARANLIYADRLYTALLLLLK
ncbi:MAG: SGNH/GDSL hydrolase family protein [Bacteroidota bacterium]